MRVIWGQVKRREGHLGLALGLVSSLESILKAEIYMAHSTRSDAIPLYPICVNIDEEI